MVRSSSLAQCRSQRGVAHLERAAVAVGRRMVGAARQVGAAAPLASQLPVMERVARLRPWNDALQGDELLLLRELLGQAHRAFVGLGPAAAEERLLQPARGDLGELLRQVCHRGRVVDVGAAVHQQVHLRLGGRDDLGVAVPRVDHRDARKKVRVDLPVVPGDGAALGAGDRHRFHRLHERGIDVFLVFFSRIHRECSLLTCGRGKKWSRPSC